MTNGETLLYSGDPNLPIEVDVVFVHGLRGDSIRTWSKGTVCWPRDLLPAKAKSARIFTWGYVSSVAKTSGPSSQASIFGHGENLLSDLVRVRQEDDEETRPLIFIGHSLGGLVIKQALIRAAQYLHNGQDRARGEIYRATEGIVFLGTPHRGSSKAGLAEIISNVVKIGLRQPNDKLIEVLKRESQVLEQQSSAFSSISKDIPLACMAEEEGTGIGVIVPKSSATLDGFNVKTGDIPSNHMDMCKFAGHDDIGYKRVAQFITSFARGAREKRGKDLVKNILSSLEFPQMDYREKTVADSWAKTFEWLLPAPADDPAPSQPKDVEFRQFIDWIRSDKPELFWICGKAGSGKSTLMKKLFSHAELRRHVRMWAIPDPVAFAAFYFYDRGEQPLQKSREGLFRAILHQLVSAHPELARSLVALIPALIPSEDSSSDRGHDPIDWSWERLCAAFNIIKEQPKQTKKIKLCLFLDGLDEYSALDTPTPPWSSGNSKQLNVDRYHEKRRQNLTEIRDLVLTLTDSPLIKICVSSRPLTAFEPAFSEMPLIRLEDLTTPDIQRFVSDKFQKCPKWLALSSKNEEKSSGLINDIVSKASGVFLWVAIVVRRVLEELEDGSHVSEIKRYLDSLPTELHELYERMLKDVKSEHKEQGVKLFHLFQAMRRPQSLLLLHYAETATTESVLSIGTGRDPVMSLEEAGAITSQMRDRLKSRCAGLLEVSNTSYAIGLQGLGGVVRHPARIDFHVRLLHQTVKDFLLGDFEWPKSHLHASEDVSDISLRLLRASIMGLKITAQTTPPMFLSPTTTSSGSLDIVYAWELVDDAIHYAQLLEQEGNQEAPLVALLDDLNSTGSKVFARTKPDVFRAATDIHWVTTGFPKNCIRDRNSHDDFLSFAIQAGLKSYVAHKLQHQIQQKKGKPYLEYAVAPLARWEKQPSDNLLRISTITECFEPDVVKIILKHGADPNEFYERSGSEFGAPHTVWGSVVSYSHRMMFPSEYLEVLDREQVQRDHGKWIENIKLLIEAGADPNVCVPSDTVSWNEPADRPLSILRTALRDYPEERDEIVHLLLEKGAMETPPAKEQLTEPSPSSDIKAVITDTAPDGKAKKSQQPDHNECEVADPDCSLFTLCLPFKCCRRHSARGNRNV